VEHTQNILLRVAVIGLSAAVVVALGLACAQARPDRRGWRHLRAGAMHWTALGLCVALTCFMSFIWLFVGSSRPDAAFQMTVLFWLIVAFGLGGVVAGVSIIAVARSAIRWRGGEIAFAAKAGVETRALADIVAMRSTPWGSVSVAFSNGAMLRVDPYATGASQLLDAIAARLDAAKPDRDES